MGEVEKYKDLKQFEKEFNERIKIFLEGEGKPENRIVFLNADYGLGKTTFFKEILGIPENNIFSPWMNKGDNLLEDIYYSVTQNSKVRATNLVIVLSFIFAFLSVVGTCLNDIVVNWMGLDYSEETELFTKNYVATILLLALFVILSVIAIIYVGNVSFLSIFNKRYGAYYEERMISELMSNVRSCLVIEDIDRCDNIEEILSALLKISDYIKKHNSQKGKYIIIGADIARTARRMNPGLLEAMSNNNQGIVTNERGRYVLDRTIGMYINFPGLDVRIENLLKEYNLYENTSAIERDEIMLFLLTKELNIRFFNTFVIENINMLKGGSSIFYVLLEYYYYHLYGNISKKEFEKSFYNSGIYPICMNDFEMLLQMSRSKIQKNIDKKSINNVSIPQSDKRPSSISNIINLFWEMLFSLSYEDRWIFKETYLSGLYPYMETDRVSNDNTISIGSSIHLICNMETLEHFILGTITQQMSPANDNNNYKRCYWGDSVNSAQVYKNMFKNVNRSKLNEKPEVIERTFIVKYIAAFYRLNQMEFEINYPEINKIFQAYLKEVYIWEKDG